MDILNLYLAIREVKVTEETRIILRNKNGELGDIEIDDATYDKATKTLIIEYQSEMG